MKNSSKNVEGIREMYPVGTRVEVINPNASKYIPVGTRGTVRRVTDTGEVDVKLDNGVLWIFPCEKCEKNNFRILVGEFTKTIRDQILAIRDSGKTNMLDVPRVQQIANQLGYYELVLFLIDHAKEYVNFIMTGKAE